MPHFGVPSTFKREHLMSGPTTAPLESAPTPDLAQLTCSEFIAAIVYLYRGELGEATVWRSRIATTTHWTIVLSATTLTLILSQQDSTRHILIPIVDLFVTFLLLIEARRYPRFDIWRSRACLLEINFYRPILDGEQPQMREWAQRLAHDLEWPHTHMAWWEATGRRLRRNYQWIYIVLLSSWLLVLSSNPEPTFSLADIIAHRLPAGHLDRLRAEYRERD